jgi:hypothetical protein
MNQRAMLAAAFALAALGIARASDAGDAAVPAPGFAGDRYAALWTKSPFAIATPEAAASSTDYSLVGLAQFGGVTYVSLVDKQTQEHFVLTNDRPVRNLTLVSISHGSDGASAVIQRNGEMLTLKQETAPAPGSSTPNPPLMALAANGPLPSVGGVAPRPNMLRPPVRFHRPPITIPPPPQ